MYVATASRCSNAACENWFSLFERQCFAHLRGSGVRVVRADGFDAYGNGLPVSVPGLLPLLHPEIERADVIERDGQLPDGAGPPSRG